MPAASALKRTSAITLLSKKQLHDASGNASHDRAPNALPRVIIASVSFLIRELQPRSFLPTGKSN
jgi:hypothetical protein